MLKILFEILLFIKLIPLKNYLGIMVKYNRGW